MMWDEKNTAYLATAASVGVHILIALIICGLAAIFKPEIRKNDAVRAVKITIINPDDVQKSSGNRIKEVKADKSKISSKIGKGAEGRKGYPLRAGIKMGVGGNGRPATKVLQAGKNEKKTETKKTGLANKAVSSFSNEAEEDGIDPDAAFLSRLSRKIEGIKKQRRRSLETDVVEDYRRDERFEVPIAATERSDIGNDAVVPKIKKTFNTINGGNKGSNGGGGIGSSPAVSGNSREKVGGAGGDIYGGSNGDGTGAEGGGRGGSGGGNGSGSGDEGNGNGNGGGMMCPDGMVFVPSNAGIGSFCIDKYEYPNNAGAMPKKGVSYDMAVRLCAADGKRLCTDGEWQKACQGVRKAMYPYGAEYVAGKCNAGMGGESSASGKHKGCVSDYHVYDMSGNLWEWVAARSGESTKPGMRGGSYDKGGSSNCSAHKTSSGTAADDVGFRCCY